VIAAGEADERPVVSSVSDCEGVGWVAVGMVGTSGVVGGMVGTSGVVGTVGTSGAVGMVGTTGGLADAGREHVSAGAANGSS
jgi:hypothetical protein